MHATDYYGPFALDLCVMQAVKFTLSILKLLFVSQQIIPDRIAGMYV